jgi:hypothetical protein
VLALLADPDSVFEQVATRELEEVAAARRCTAATAHRCPSPAERAS